MNKFLSPLLLSLLFGIVFNTSAQILDPVKWETSYEKIDETTYDLILEATIDEGWHLYSQEIIDDGEGPLPTEISFLATENNFELIGKTSEPDIPPVFDNVFDMEIKYFSDQATFKQRIKLTNIELKFIEAEVYYMACDDEKCLPPELKTLQIPLKDNVTVTKKSVELSDKDKELASQLVLDLKGKENFQSLEEEESKKGFLTIFLLGFVGGLIALLTPCVFPMIPLTVSFFTKSAQDRKKGTVNAILYGLFIFLIYLLLSLPFHLLDTVNPEVLNNISTNVALNVIFFIIFMVFAFSFFGYFELTLPSSWSAKMDSKATKIGGGVGIFFMALTLAIVSFSCTGPILGSLLGGALTSDGGAMQLTFGMGGFGLALALPFALFAMFPNWLNSLPKSGGWLNTVKVILGFAEIALAFKFLSNADLVEGWGLIKRELFIGLWIVIFAGLALYLFGLIRFPHDSPNQKIGFGRKTLAIITSVFVLYMIPGLTNHQEYKNLKLLSGFPPPMFYSYYAQKSECPLGLNCFKDWDEGVAYAKEHNKPILLDFTGWACVNCRKMEENVWSETEVYNLINDNYVLISLYVDDRKDLPEDKQFDFERTDGNVKKIKTIGDKWATFQIVNFQTASQPYYLLLSPDLEMLNIPKEYTDKEDYTQWLKMGLENFRR